MRELTDHRVNETNEALKITVLDEPGAGGANHQYQITWSGEIKKPTIEELEKMLAEGKKPNIAPSGAVSLSNVCFIGFQNGPIKEAGVNGVTQEALMAIVIDRLRSFQAGPYSCKENSVALTHIETAMLWLQKRTRDRQARGVEGTSTK